MTPVSLCRALSKLGCCSRKQAEAWVTAGRVGVNARVVRDPGRRVDLGADRIEVDGQAVVEPARVYLMLNKPRGLVTTASDEQGRETVYACLAGAKLPWVSPVGRLDKASEGLLLLTNDSRWGARLVDPRSHVDKTYHVQIDRLVDESLLRRVRAGVKRVSLLRSGVRNSWLEVVLDEGRNRQIRRLLSASDVSVLRLVRVAVGSLRLGALGRGEWRALSAAERDALDQPVALEPATKRERSSRTRAVRRYRSR